MIIKYFTFTSALLLCGCSTFVDPPYPVVETQAVSQKAVNNALLSEFAFRNLERRIDRIRRGDVVITPDMIEMKELYGALPDRNESTTQIISEYDAEIGVIQRSITSDHVQAWSVVFEFGDKSTAKYMAFALQRAGFTNRRIDPSDPTRILAGTFSNPEAAMRRKAYLDTLLDWNLSRIQQIKVAQD